MHSKPLRCVALYTPCVIVVALRLLHKINVSHLRKGNVTSHVFYNRSHNTLQDTYSVSFIFYQEKTKTQFSYYVYTTHSVYIIYRSLFECEILYTVHFHICYYTVEIDPL